MQTGGGLQLSAEAPGAGALGAWTAARAKEYGVVAQRRDADGAMIDRALEIVREFIVEKGLILFGGLAIDYALRLKGGHIYPADQRPDFDFLSPRSVDDAYDLADRLHRAGFEGVGAVRGIHVQTMRVRTDFVYVADIGYAPPEVFARIPTFDYRGMRVVHPDFQRMDIHLAFCFPFNGPPREDVFHRWRKDLARLNLYEVYYPLAPPPGRYAAARRVEATLGTPVTGPPRDLRVALHGFAAYAVLRGALDDLAARGLPVEAVGAPRLALEFPDARTVAVEAPAGGAVVVATPWPEAAVAGLPGVRRYDPYMDVCPESLRAGPLTVLSVRSRLLAVSVANPGGRGPTLVATPQYLLLWLLYEAHRAAGTGEEAVYRAYYVHTLEVLRAAEKAFAEMPVPPAEAMDVYANSPFAPTVHTLGDVNHDAAYIIKMAGNAQKLHDTPPPALGLDPSIADLLRGVPQNYYPGTAKHRPAADYSSVWFRRAGAPSEALPEARAL
jgi:hypothetical protein